MYLVSVPIAVAKMGFDIVRDEQRRRTEHTTEQLPENQERKGAIWLLRTVRARWPTFATALERLPYSLLVFALSQFVLVEALAERGWVSIFAVWLARATPTDVPVAVTVIVVLCLTVVLCNLTGTNIGATILVVRMLQDASWRSRPGMTRVRELIAGIAVIVGSNIGAINIIIPASLAGKGELTAHAS